MVGVGGPDQIAAFVQKLVDAAPEPPAEEAPADPVQEAMQAAGALLAGFDFESAVAAFQAIADGSLDDAVATAGMKPADKREAASAARARGLLGVAAVLREIPGREGEAAEAVATLRKKFAKQLELPGLAREIASIELEMAADASGDADFAANLAADPADHASRLALAHRLAADGAAAEAAEHALVLMRDAPAFEDGAAKALLLNIFAANGDADFVADARKRFANLLYR